MIFRLQDNNWSSFDFFMFHLATFGVNNVICDFLLGFVYIPTFPALSSLLATHETFSRPGSLGLNWSDINQWRGRSSPWWWPSPPFLLVWAALWTVSAERWSGNTHTVQVHTHETSSTQLWFVRGTPTLRWVGTWQLVSLHIKRRVYTHSFQTKCMLTLLAKQLQWRFQLNEQCEKYIF